MSLVATVALLAGACSSSTMTPMTPTSPSAASTAPAGESAPVPSPAPPAQAPANASYRVTFQATWVAATHPVEFPSSAHFSPLVGGTHNGMVTFWQEGAPASDGIKDMAERGATAALTQEISAAIAAGTAERAMTAGGIGTPGSVSLEFEISQAFPLVTLVSMIAPSPDWFVGVSRLPLFERGEWVSERRVELVPWDAGTDSGVTFTSPDLATAPRRGVAPIVTAPLSPGGVVTPLGTFTFTRLGL